MDMPRHRFREVDDGHITFLFVLTIDRCGRLRRQVFFHESGQAKATDLATDGTFKLVAFQGKNRIAIECYEPDKANPNSYGRATLSLGKSLIPRRYAEAGTSGLSHEVSPGDNNVTFTLKQ
jgi:hypothetical protein